MGTSPIAAKTLPSSVIVHLSRQIGVQLQAYSDGEWNELTLRQQRSQIRAHCGFRAFRARDEPTLIAWLSERVNSTNPEAEALKFAAYNHLRALRVGPPPTERMRRLLRLAVAHRQERLVAETAAQLSLSTRAALDALVQTQAPDDGIETEQMELFPVRSELSTVKEGAGAVKVETVLEEIAKLKQLRALGLPEKLFRDAPAKLVTHYRQRAASEPPRELRRHPPQVRYTLLAALC